MTASEPQARKWMSFIKILTNLGMEVAHRLLSLVSIVPPGWGGGIKRGSSERGRGKA